MAVKKGLAQALLSAVLKGAGPPTVKVREEALYGEVYAELYQVCVMWMKGRRETVCPFAFVGNIGER
jgi:hypothetical protein